MTPAARLAVLESLPLTADERAAVLVQVEQLARAVDDLEAFVTPATEPATGFDPLLGGEA